MKTARWGMFVVLVSAMVVVCGCMPWKTISVKEYQDLSRLQDMNERQAQTITARIFDVERLNDEVNSLKIQLEKAGELAVQKDDALRTKADLLAMHKKEIENLTNEMEGLRGNIPDLGADIEIVSQWGATGIRMASDVLFDPGKAALKASGKKLLTRVANFEQVRGPKTHLRICGFTDSDPIKYSHWKSNDELSGARALAALEFLASQGIDRARMHFVGFGKHFLIHDADGKENKKRSRRIEIYLLDEKMMARPGSEGEAPAPAVPVVTPK